jgi:hypothetical protein
MGCDIHLHIEIKLNGKWEHYATPSLKRKYRLFAAMADVRNGDDITPIAYPRGFPIDASLITTIDYERFGLDAHSASVFYEEDIERLVFWLKEEKKRLEAEDESRIDLFTCDLEWDILNRTYLFGNAILDMWKYPDEWQPEGYEGVRFVFWFDN